VDEVQVHDAARCGCFDELTRIIGAHNGIVTQFQGDAVLATFNVPVEDAGHAGNAFGSGP
jgi:class 3 adenylate cyclase